jgi:Tol biopolymer transport system component
MFNGIQERKYRMRYLARVLIALTCLVSILAVAALPASAQVPGPNGRIVFNRYDPTVGDFHAFIINADGSNEKQLLPGIADCPTWSPDGEKILVCVFTAQGLLRPATLNPDGSGFRLLDVQDPSLNLGCGAWSSRGRLACESWDDVHPDRIPGIFTVRASDGGDLMRVTANPYGGHDRVGDYSPDGTRIVFGRENPGLQKIGIFVVNVDGSGLHQISAWQPDFGTASWSPDGKWILTDNAQGSLYVVRPDGTGEHQIILHTGPGFSFAFEPGWSPDGKRIVFSLYRASVHQEDLFTAGADGTDLQQVTNTPDQEEFANWGTSPD